MFIELPSHRTDAAVARVMRPSAAAVAMVRRRREEVARGGRRRRGGRAHTGTAKQEKELLRARDFEIFSSEG